MKRDELPITHQLIAYLPLCLCINIGFRDHLLFPLLVFPLSVYLSSEASRSHPVTVRPRRPSDNLVLDRYQ